MYVRLFSRHLESRPSTADKRSARPDLIDKDTHEIRQDEEKIVYKSLEEVGDELPDHSPRFILLSYPLTMVGAYVYTLLALLSQLTRWPMQPDGRLSVPYVLLYYLPITCNAPSRMLYAGAKELMRNTSEVGRVIDIESAEELEDIPKRLEAGN